MNENPMQVVEMRWTVDGDEFVAVRLPSLEALEDIDPVGLLQVVLECSRLEAEHAFQVIMEDGEFVTSVVGDIDLLD